LYFEKNIKKAIKSTRMSAFFMAIKFYLLLFIQSQY
jgi:hypothetical protein